jgi:hypothetical protein
VLADVAVADAQERHRGGHQPQQGDAGEGGLGGKADVEEGSYPEAAQAGDPCRPEVGLAEAPVQVSAAAEQARGQSQLQGSGEQRYGSGDGVEDEQRRG